MIELRADGSREGAPKVARIYRMSHNGKLEYTIWAGEFETDLPAYLETYKNFRGWATEFVPYEGSMDKLQELRAAGFTPAEKDAELVRHLKYLFTEAHSACEKAAYAYFSACPVGEERNRASDVYENIRTATRI